MVVMNSPPYNSKEHHKNPSGRGHWATPVGSQFTVRKNGGHEFTALQFKRVNVS
jgi:hypothetical protein